VKKRTLLTSLLVFVLATMLSVSVAAQDDEQITLEYWDYWVTQGPAVDAAIELFEEMNPNINIEKTTIGGGPYEESLDLAFQGETGPDVFVAPGEEAIFNLYANNGWLLDLMQFEDAEEFMNSFPDPDINFLEGDNVIDGALYTAPFFPGRAWLQLYVNTRLYEEAGLVEDDGSLMLPETWEQMVENSRVIKEETGAFGTGFSMQQTWAAGWWMQFCQYSGPWDHGGPGPSFDVRTGEYTFSTNECAQAVLNSLVQMRDEELIHPASLGFAIDDEGARVLFATHEFAHLVAGEWVIAGWENTNPEFEEFTTVRLPVVIGEEPSSYFASGMGGRWFSVNANTEHPEAAWEFFKFLNGPDFAQIWSELGNGLLIQTPEPYDQYADHPAWEYIFSAVEDVRVVPQRTLRNPDLTEVQITLTGPTIDDVFVGIVSGEIEDIDAALVDLEERYTAALMQGIEDAQSAGFDVSIEDYIFEDWNPLEDFITTLADE